MRLSKYLFALTASVAILIPAFAYAQYYDNLDPYTLGNVRGRNTRLVDLTISDDPEPVVDDQTLTYTITLRNRQNYESRMRVLATIDPQTTVLSSSGDGVEFRDSVEWRQVRIGPESEVRLTVRVRTKKSLSGDRLTFRVNADGYSDTEYTSIDLRPTGVAPPSVPFTNQARDFEAILQSRVSGDTVHYTLTVANRTNRTLNDVRAVHLFHTLTREIQILNADGGVDRGDRITWNLGTLRPFEFRTFTTSVRFSNNVPSSTVEATSESPKLKVLANDTRSTRNVLRDPVHPVDNRYAYIPEPAPGGRNVSYGSPNVVYPRTGVISDLFGKREDLGRYLSDPKQSSSAPLIAVITAMTLAGATAFTLKRVLI